MNGRVVDGRAPLSHHLFQIPQAQTVGQYQRTQSSITVWSNRLPLNIQSSGNVRAPLAAGVVFKTLKHNLRKAGFKLRISCCARFRSHRMGLNAPISALRENVNGFTWQAGMQRLSCGNGF